MSNINKHFEDLEVPYYLRRVVDGLSLLIGNVVAYGQYRIVFEHALEPKKYVVKYEFKEDPHCNLLESVIWADLKDTKHGKYLAPIELISDDGRWIIQRRCFPCTDYPKKIPRIFNFDAKIENWGMLQPENRFVCFDYANVALFSHEKNLNLETVKWWNLHEEI